MGTVMKLKEIDEQIKTRYPGKVILDGIVDPETFEKMETKILWILKETNGFGENLEKNGWWSLNESLYEDVGNHTNWKRTWGLVMEITYAIIHKARNWEEVPLLAHLKDKDNTIRQIAVINVKKTPGNSKSNYKKIKANYHSNKYIILGQIEAISPNVIINCSGVNELFNDLKTGKEQPIAPFYAAKSEYGIIINAYHPNQKTLAKEKYFENIRDCINLIS